MTIKERRIAKQISKNKYKVYHTKQTNVNGYITPYVIMSLVMV